MSSGFDIGGLRCFPSAREPDTWNYVPVAADLQRDEAGRPMLALTDSGSGAYLLFTARWSADAAALEALRTEIASRTGSPDPAAIRLSFAQVSEPVCLALLGDGRGAFDTAATSATSGYPPYHAVFQLFLETERLARVRAALCGQAGFLAVEYRAELAVPVRARGTFTAPPDLFAWIRSHGAVAEGDLADLLEEAVREDHARVVVDVPEPHAGKLVPAIYRRILGEAAATVKRGLDGGLPGAIDIALTLDQTVDESIRAQADLGALLAAAGTRMLPGGQDAAN